MKKHFILPVMIASLFMAIPFVSCSDDDEAFEAAVAAARARESQKPAPTPTPPPEPPAPPATFTVTFDLNGGTSTDTLEYTVNNGAQLSSVCSYLPIATKEDYWFVEWRTNPDGTGSGIWSTNQNIYSSVKYYAIWKKLVKTISTETTDMSLKIGEQKSFTVTYSPADAAGEWTARNNSSSSIADFRVNDKGDGVVEFTFTGQYVGSGIYSVADSKSNKAYAINVSVSAPDTTSIPELTIGTAASSNPADYAGLDKTLDSTTPMLLYKVNLEANTSYTFQCASSGNMNLPGVTNIGYCSIYLYNSNFTSSIGDTRSISGVGFGYRPSSATTCYLVIKKYSDTAKAGVHVYKTPSVTAINLLETTVNLTLGNESSKYVEFATTPADAYMNLLVTSSDDTIASPSYWYGDKYFNIYPRSAGTATFTIKDTLTNVSTTCTVIVTGTNATSLSFSQNTLSISQGETKTLTVTPTPENATVSYSWSISDVGGSYIPCDGRIIANLTRSDKTFTITGGVIPGAVTLRVSDSYSSKSATCTITNSTGITGSAITEELPIVGNTASTSLADYTIVNLNNAQPVKYYKVVVPAANSGKMYNFQTARSGHNPIIGETFVAGDCYFYLYDENFVLKGRWWSSQSSFNLTAGTYYFAVVYGSPNTTSNYSAKGGVHLYVTD